MLTARMRLLSVTLLALALPLSAPTAAQPSRPRPQAVAAARPHSFDLLIAGGRVLDGTGNPAYYADVGIRGGRGSAMGRPTGAHAARSAHPRGKGVAPGFIDIHSASHDRARQ